MNNNLIPPHGGYRQLKSFQQSELVYDATVKFCDRFIDRRSRTHDQMVRAARSGRQNIAEGSQASGTSKKFELKLVGVARARLEELLLDYEDFLRQRGFKLWDKNHPTAKEVRHLAYEGNRSYLTYASYIEKASPEIAANTVICLIHQTNYLLDQQLRQFEKAFLQEGGFTERLYKARTAARKKQYKETMGPIRPICPIQTLEHIDESRKEIGPMGPPGPISQEELFDTRGRQLKGWTNKLIWVDNKLILFSLSAQDYSA